MHDSHPLLEDLVAVLLGEADEPTRERSRRPSVRIPGSASSERLRATIDAAQAAAGMGSDVLSAEGEQRCSPPRAA